jgi:uncharacterized protein
VRWLLLALAVLSLALAVIGAFLPIMPTVPFLILAAWAAARSSPRLSHWLETHSWIGPLILDWRRGGVIRRGAKWMATIAMAGGCVSMTIFVRPGWVAAIAIGVLVIVALWIWQRPEAPPA